MAHPAPRNPQLDSSEQVTQVATLKSQDGLKGGRAVERLRRVSDGRRCGAHADPLMPSPYPGAPAGPSLALVPQTASVLSTVHNHSYTLEMTGNTYKHCCPELAQDQKHQTLPASCLPSAFLKAPWVCYMHSQGWRPQS